MAALFKRPNMAVAAGFGLLGMATIGGFAAGFNARAALTAAGLRASALGEMSPSDTVTLRFPNEWAEAAGSAPMMVAVASADPGFTLFDPVPTYPVGTAVPTAASEAALEQGRPTVQPAASVPARPVLAARPTHRSNAVLNESQLASIKRRLNLTREQERYWPPVEAELRKLEYKKDPKSPQGTRTAAVDMSKVNVEGLKSAGFPLIMSFNDDQRQELKSLAHLLGLESVISNF
jgi:hypothetical protein